MSTNERDAILRLIAAVDDVMQIWDRGGIRPAFIWSGLEMAGCWRELYDARGHMQEILMEAILNE